MNTIDADGHIVEKTADVLRHLPEPYSKRSGGLLPSDGMDTNMGGLLGGWKATTFPRASRTWTQKGSMSPSYFQPAVLA